MPTHSPLYTSTLSLLQYPVQVLALPGSFLGPLYLLPAVALRDEAPAWDTALKQLCRGWAQGSDLSLSLLPPFSDLLC